ncbi:MAG: ATP-binding protein [Victivallales bacterium]|nr:ATP-binding protein [Victivallales bacterium]
MRFFDRRVEIQRLREIRERSQSVACFTVVTGRRRIGKTELVKHAYGDSPYLYLYVVRAAEADLCDGFQRRIEEFTGRTLPGRVKSFSSLFRYLLELAHERHLTVVIDEFQDFLRVSPSVFSEMQRDWDELSGSAHINLVVMGSVNSLMNRIFCDRKEPLYGRETDHLTVRPFEVSALKEILSSYNPKYKPDDLLGLWTFTGGVAKYVALFMDRGAITRDKMLNVILEEDSFFMNEGWAVLMEEFGKNYGTYFSILSAIACGKTSRAEIMNEIGGEASGYLTRLEEQYELLAKHQPLFEPTNNKNCRYKMTDNFFRFWFRFIFKYQYLIQVRMFEELRRLVQRDYELFSGIALERYFQAKFLEEHAYTHLGGWWDRKGENEIDLVGENEFQGALDFYEVKREARRIDLNALQRKASAFFKKNPHLQGRTVSFSGLSLDDM